jgi:hypothetical protein
LSRGKPHKPRSPWKDADKTRAVAVYKSLGVISKTVEVTGIPYDTLYLWMRSEWWKEKMQQLKAEDTAELGEAATDIAKQAARAVQDRLSNGDHVLLRDGQLVRKPVSAKDAAIVMGISLSKRKELAEEPLREQQLGTAERLLKLVEQFTKFASNKETKRIIDKQEQILDVDYEEVLKEKEEANA